MGLQTLTSDDVTRRCLRSSLPLRKVAALMTHLPYSALIGTLCGVMAVTFAFRYWGQHDSPAPFPRSPRLSLFGEVGSLTLGLLLGRVIGRPWPLLVALAALAIWCAVKVTVMWVRAPAAE